MCRQSESVYLTVCECVGLTVCECVCVCTRGAVSGGGVEAGHGDDEQGVGAGAVFVQVGAGRRPVHVAQLQHLQGPRSPPQDG